MPALRPLPARPSLEYERKDARSLLRSLRAARPEAIARARTYLPPDRRSPAAGYRLSDAQLILAREYGFASWPRLVRYFGDVARQSRTIDGGERSRDRVHDDLVRSLLACGADPDIVGWRPNQSACDIAKELASQTPNDAAVARIVELLGAAG